MFLLKRRNMLTSMLAALPFRHATALALDAKPVASNLEGPEGILKDRYPKVLVNHRGFTPTAGKFCVASGITGAKDFMLVNMLRGKGPEPAFMGTLERSGNDLGEYLVGDFSNFQQPGTYRIAIRGNYPFWSGAGGRMDIWSHNFTIGPAVWDDVIRKLVQYYRVQSCGPSKYGFRTPCHCGPIRRDDGQEARPVTGGWHSAHDFQRDMVEILHAEYGLLYLAMARPDLEESEHLFEEIRWGNDYFLSIQNPSHGYLAIGVMATDYTDWQHHDWLDSASYTFYSKPAASFLQHDFIVYQAQIARHYHDRHPEYARTCLEAARRCFAYLQKNYTAEDRSETAAMDAGSGALAGVQMFRATGEEVYRDYGSRMASRLVALQTPAGAWSDSSADLTSIYGPLTAVGLCAAVQYLRDDPNHAQWQAALGKFASLCRSISTANSFGIMPCRCYSGAPPQRARTCAGQTFRYFIETNHKPDSSFYWQTGNIAAVSGYGVAMMYMSSLLKEPWLMQLAQRQLDWALGVNPFDASMILGVGRNQPPTYPSKEIVPGIPDIDGAVLQGPQGDAGDNAIVLPGVYASCEYWLPHQSWTLWLMAEISAQRN